VSAEAARKKKKKCFPINLWDVLCCLGISPSVWTWARPLASTLCLVLENKDESILFWCGISTCFLSDHSRSITPVCPNNQNYYPADLNEWLSIMESYNFFFFLLSTRMEHYTMVKQFFFPKSSNDRLVSFPPLPVGILWRENNLLLVYCLSSWVETQPQFTHLANLAKEGLTTINSRSCFQINTNGV